MRYGGIMIKNNKWRKILKINKKKIRQKLRKEKRKNGYIFKRRMDKEKK